MKLVDGKLIVTEEELKYVKQANMNSSPSIAGLFLQSSNKRNHLLEEVEEPKDVKYFIECIIAYRKKNYEVVNKEGE